MAVAGGVIGPVLDVSGVVAGASTLGSSGPVVSPGPDCPGAGGGTCGWGGADPGISGPDVEGSVGWSGFGVGGWETGTFDLGDSGWVVGRSAIEPWDSDGFWMVSVFVSSGFDAAVLGTTGPGLGLAADPLAGSDGLSTVPDEVEGLDGEPTLFSPLVRVRSSPTGGSIGSAGGWVVRFGGETGDDGADGNSAREVGSVSSDDGAGAATPAPTSRRLNSSCRGAARLCRGRR